MVDSFLGMVDASPSTIKHMSTITIPDSGDPVPMIRMQDCNMQLLTQRNQRFLNCWDLSPGHDSPCENTTSVKTFHLHIIMDPTTDGRPPKIRQTWIPLNTIGTSNPCHFRIKQLHKTQKDHFHICRLLGLTRRVVWLYSLVSHPAIVPWGTQELHPSRVLSH